MATLCVFDDAKSINKRQQGLIKMTCQEMRYLVQTQLLQVWKLTSFRRTFTRSLSSEFRSWSFMKAELYYVRTKVDLRSLIERASSMKMFAYFVVPSVFQFKRNLGASEKGVGFSVLGWKTRLTWLCWGQCLVLFLCTKVLLVRFAKLENHGSVSNYEEQDTDVICDLD